MIDVQQNERLKSRDEDFSLDIQSLDLSDQQISDSFAHLDSLKNDKIRNVTHIRVLAGSDENNRRKQYTDERNTWLRCHKNEHVKLTNNVSLIQRKWQENHQISNKDELKNSIQNIRSIYSDIIESKKDLISQFKRRLKHKDEDYILLLKKQEYDTTKTSHLIQHELSQLEDAHKDQLQLIEDAFGQDRYNLIESQKDDISNILDKKLSLEVGNIKNTKDRINSQSESLDKAQREIKDTYQELKYKLQSEIERLECELEAKKADYRSSEYYIGFDHRVLTEKIVDGEEKIKKRKKRILKLKEEFNEVNAKRISSALRDEKANFNLEQDYKRIEGQHVGLESKLRRYEEVDEIKYKCVIQMHNEEIQNMIKRIELAVQRITETILGR